MDYSQYVVKTLIAGAMKLGPIIVMIGLGYLVFIKLPFVFFRRGMKMAKEEKLPEFPRIEPKIERPQPKVERRQEKPQERREPPKQERRQEKTERPKPAPEQKASLSSPEEIFEFKPGQSFTMDELKKKHRELLKGCHPDRVAALDPEFKKLADRRSKEINAAYEKLKSKAV